MNDTKPIKWFQSYTGKRLFPLSLKVSDVEVEEIAHALAMKCRFNGHCNRFYSVAQHSVLVSQFVPRALALPALLHDGAEYVLPDVVTPVKHQLKGFAEIEEAALDAIFKRFGIIDVRYDDAAMRLIKEADLRVLAIEARDLMPNKPEDWRIPYEPDPYIEITPWLPDEAKAQFLSRYEQILESALTNPSMAREA